MLKTYFTTISVISGQRNICFFLLMLSFSFAVSVQVQETEDQSATALAKKAQNPIADMISLPIQYNSFFETGPEGKTQSTVIIQPVMPFNLNDDWKLITRPIIPLMEMPPLTDTQNRNHGMGNIQLQTFFSPKEEASACDRRSVSAWQQRDKCSK